MELRFRAATDESPGEVTAHLADGTKVGYASYMFDEPWPPIVLYVEVDESHRRSGIASALLDELKARLGVRHLEPGMLVENGRFFWQSYEAHRRLPPRLTTLEKSPSADPELSAAPNRLNP